MLAAERRSLILEQLQKDKKVIVTELAEKFDCSQETIRRDLDRLDKEGLAIKGYGGAVLNESDGNDTPFRVRQMKNPDGKKAIAEIIADLINDGEHVTLDASTTSLSIVKALREKKRLTIITNSIEILVELNDASGWDVISTGGTLKDNYFALVGPRAVDGFESFNADKVVFSCKGIDMEKGITDGNELFTQAKKAMIGSAAEKILAIDSTKFSVVSFSKICDVTDIDTVVTDEKPSDEWLEYFAEKGIRCLYED